MRILVSGATATLRSVEDDRFGVLVVPGSRSNPGALPLRPGQWAIDNGAYSGLDAVAFLHMLERYHPSQASQASHGSQGCLFVAAPDVVGHAAATLERWPFWSQLLRGIGFPPALVAQDGLTPDQVPWDELGALFIGGTTDWKISTEARTLVSYAKSRGLHVHMGRVNTRQRLRLAMRWGVDTVDGSGFSQWPDTNIAIGRQWLTDLHRQRELSL